MIFFSNCLRDSYRKHEIAPKSAEIEGGMLVFWEQRLVVLATPKTGTTAIAAALEALAAVSIQRPPELKHTPIRRYRRFIGPYLERAANAPFTVVGVMREPRDWLGSWYRYRQRDGIADPRKSTAGISFDDFVQAHCKAKPPAFAGVGGQAGFLRHADVPGVDRIFRYDRTGDLVTFLEERLQFEIHLPRLNVSPTGKTDLSVETAALLHRFCAPEFALYDQICRAEA
jgi:hypothetical protein